MTIKDKKDKIMLISNRMKSCKKHSEIVFYYRENAYPHGCPLCLAEKMEEECRPLKQKIRGRKNG